MAIWQFDCMQIDYIFYGLWSPVIWYFSFDIVHVNKNWLQLKCKLNYEIMQTDFNTNQHECTCTTKVKYSWLWLFHLKFIETLESFIPFKQNQCIYGNTANCKRSQRQVINWKKNKKTIISCKIHIVQCEFVRNASAYTMWTHSISVTHNNRLSLWAICENCANKKKTTKCQNRLYGRMKKKVLHLVQIDLKRPADFWTVVNWKVLSK